MATIYSCFYEQLATGAVDLESTTNIYGLLVSGSYTPDATAHTTYAGNVASNESVDSNSNYIAGGSLISGAVVSADGAETKFDAADIEIENTSMTAAGLVLYYSGLASNDLICHLSFTEATSTNGQYAVRFAETGIMRFRQGS